MSKAQKGYKLGDECTLAHCVVQFRQFRQKNPPLEQIDSTENKTSNDIIVGNGRVLKFYLFILWLYLFKMSLE